jgi:uncharacterized protein (TIGR02145 family)
MKTLKPILFLLLAIVLVTCKKWDNPYDPDADTDAKAKVTTALITTSSASNITKSSASCGGDVKSDGYSKVTARGVCWDTIRNPTVTGRKTSDGNGQGTYTSTLNGLNAGTIYYFRAYATNNKGIAYGEELSFTTNAIYLPAITTNAISSITETSATSGGNITNDGGDNITACGICWGTASNPTIDLNTKTIVGSGTGSFTSNLTGLTAGTIYYVRAYATNIKGTVYGNEVNFSTSFSIPTLTTTSITVITQNTANSGGNITNDGGAAITAYGVCWSTTSNPTTDLTTKTIDGKGTGAFTSNLTGLTDATTYYVRAYATNSTGTAYGNEVSFTTIASSTGNTVTDIDGNTYKTVVIGTQTWMAENLKTTKYNDGTTIPNVTDGATWAVLSTPAYCWYNNDAATNKATYGALYNWYTVNTAKLAPTGWHVPTDAEWSTLTTYLGGESVTGGKLKETGTTHWTSPNTGASNSSGFTALPGGQRYSINGAFGDFGYYVGWWSSSENNSTNAWSRYVDYYGSNAYRSSDNKSYGFSVRCVRD